MAKNVSREKFLEGLAEVMVPYAEKLGRKLLEEVYASFQPTIIGVLAGGAIEAQKTEVTPEEAETEKLASEGLQALEAKYEKLGRLNRRAMRQKLDAEVAKLDAEAPDYETKYELLETVNFSEEKAEEAKLAEAKLTEASQLADTVKAIKGKRGMAGVTFVIKKLGLEEKPAKDNDSEEKLVTAPITSGDWLVPDLLSGNDYSYSAAFRYFPEANKLDIMPIKTAWQKNYGLELGKWYDLTVVELGNCTLLQNTCWDTIKNVAPVHTSLKKLGEAVRGRVVNGNNAKLQAGGSSNCYLISDDPRASKHVVSFAEAKEKYFTVSKRQTAEAKPEAKPEASQPATPEAKPEAN